MDFKYSKSGGIWEISHANSSLFLSFLTFVSPSLFLDLHFFFFFLLNLNPQRLWVFLWVSFDFFFCRFCLIVFMWLVSRFEMKIVCWMKFFYKLCMRCEVINKRYCDLTLVWIAWMVESCWRKLMLSIFVSMAAPGFFS